MPYRSKVTKIFASNSGLPTGHTGIYIKLDQEIMPYAADDDNYKTLKSLMQKAARIIKYNAEVAEFKPSQHSFSIIIDSRDTVEFMNELIGEDGKFKGANGFRETIETVFKDYPPKARFL